MSRPSYSMRLVQPFLKVLSGHPAIAHEWLAELAAFDRDDRVPIATVHELLEGAVALTRDPDLGLKAARAFEPGELGTLEYVVRSSNSIRDAIEVIGRYVRLLSDASSLAVESKGQRVLVRLESNMALPPISEAFELALLHDSIVRWYLHETVPNSDLYFVQPEPINTRAWRETFVGARLHFDQGFSGTAFDAASLDFPLPSPDPRLHEVMRFHADRMLRDLPVAPTFTSEVRRVLESQMAEGRASVERIAKALHVGARTLARRLEHEGTTLKNLRDDLRREIALRYASSTDTPLSQVADLLGFSSAASFHRAFKRWTGQAPFEYRRSRRG